MSQWALPAIAVMLIASGAVSGRLRSTPVSQAMVFVALGHLDGSRQGLGKVRACWFHEACDADQWQQTGGMAAQRSVVQREHLTTRPTSSPSTSTCATAASATPATQTVLSCGYRCVTDSIPSGAR